MVYTPSDEERERWREAGVPPDHEIIGGFLMSNPLIWGVPDKAEVFRHADAVTESRLNPEIDFFNVLRLRYCATPFMVPSYTLKTPHVMDPDDDIMEHNYTVALQVVTKEMHLTRIKIESGSRESTGKHLVFTGTEYPGPAVARQVRTVRVTVHELPDGSTYATYEIISETVYPTSA